MMTHKTAPATMMAVRISRRRVAASSRFNQPTQSEPLGRASRNVALMELFPRRTFDDRDSGRAYAEKIWIGIFDFDAHLESLCDPVPVQFALHIRHTCGRQIDFAFGLHCPSDSLHFSTEALVRRERKVNDCLASRSHMSNLGFAKIRDHAPFAPVEQREDRSPGGNIGTGRNVEIDNPSGKRCDDLAVGKMEFLEINGRDRTFALSL